MILLGLEVLIIADIIRTIVVSQSIESVATLGLIVLIRIVLSFSLEVEIDGAWPWNQWRIKSADGASSAPPARRRRQVRPKKKSVTAFADSYMSVTPALM